MLLTLNYICPNNYVACLEDGESKDHLLGQPMGHGLFDEP